MNEASTNSNLDRVMGTAMMPVFVKGAVVYLPHFTLAKFVGPGYGNGNKILYTAHQLRKLGAIESRRPLWMRPQFIGGVA